MRAMKGSAVAVFVSLLISVWAVQVELDLYCPRSIGGETQWTRDKFASGHFTVQGQSMSPSSVSYLMGDLGATEGRTGRGPFRRGAPDAIKNPNNAELKKRANTYTKICSRSNECKKFGGSEDIVMTDGFELLDYIKDNNISNAKYGEYVANFLPMLQDKEQNINCPKYLEPVNEGMVYVDPRKTNSKASNEQRKAAFAKIGKFHKAVCDVVTSKLKSGSCQPLCGGWASGWSDFVRQDFLPYENRLVPFTKEAGKSMKFYSFHTYDSYKQGAGEVLMRGGHIEGMMDLVWAHTKNQLGKPMPIIVSEFAAGSNDVWFVSASGTKGAAAKTARPYCATRDWAILNTITAMISQFSAHPDLILKAVPFALEGTYDSKGNPLPWSLQRKVNGKTVWTHLIKLYEILEGVKGQYYSASTQSTKVQAHLMKDGNTFWVMLKNFSKNKQTANLKFVDGIPTLSSEGAELRRLLLKSSSSTQSCAKSHKLPWSGVPALTKQKISSSSALVKLAGNLSLSPNEFVIIKIPLRVSPKARRSSKVTRHFSGREVVPISQAYGKSTANTQKFSFKNLPTGKGTVKVRVALGGYSDVLNVKCDAKLNGVNLSRPANSFGPENNSESRWMMFEYYASLSSLKQSSEVAVTCSCSKCNKFNAKISSVTIITEQLSGGGGTVEPGDGNSGGDSGNSGNGGNGGGVAPPSSGNFKNGDFSNNLSGWTKSGNVQLDNSRSYKGKRSVKVSAGGTIKQAFNVSTNKNVSVSAYIKKKRASDNCELVLKQNGKLLGRKSSNKTGWNQKTASFKNARGTVEVRLSSADNKSTCWFDNVKVKQN
ncbi:hypothetical protein NDN08_004910 [Rhodosorus marinus]|uniref:CBM-cenC domain-containing protein n=1 Tax=Rhodosorus marinus TaxID=101924 RepID=A0AAV8UF21_9RHOD|nr:hypothetical protein NDN08_004910 [Rhodosorus marinus]